MKKRRWSVALIDELTYSFVDIYLGSPGKLQNAVETFACGSYSHNISGSPKIPLVFL